MHQFHTCIAYGSPARRSRNLRSTYREKRLILADPSRRGVNAAAFLSSVLDCTKHCPHQSPLDPISILTNGAVREIKVDEVTCSQNNSATNHSRSSSGAKYCVSYEKYFCKDEKKSTLKLSGIKTTLPRKNTEEMYEHYKSLKYDKNEVFKRSFQQDLRSTSIVKENGIRYKESVRGENCSNLVLRKFGVTLVFQQVSIT